MRAKFESTLAKELGLNLAETDPVWSPARFTLITGGVRAGKTTRGAFKAFKESLNPKARLIWLVGPDYTQAQEEFRMIMEWCIQLKLIRNPKEDISSPMNGQRTLRTRLGCTIQTKSAKHPETLAGVAPDGIVMCEPGQMSGEAFDMCIGRLIQKRGWMFLCGTLEDDITKPRWAWYERLAVEWQKHEEGAEQRAFSLPTWSNITVFPGGINDPEMVKARAMSSDYTWQRRYGGVPMGVENPVFPSMHESYSSEMFAYPDEDVRWVGGAIGVDYGTTFEHPSAIAVIAEDQFGRYWVRDIWLGLRVDSDELISLVSAKQDQYNIFQGCTDPNQRFMADVLGYDWAKSGAGSTFFRFSLVNGLLERNMLFFDRGGVNVHEGWNSMSICRYVTNSKKQLNYDRQSPYADDKVVYERPIGDDAAMAICYAVEKLRGGGGHDISPVLDLGPVKFHFNSGGSPMEGRV